MNSSSRALGSEFNRSNFFVKLEEVEQEDILDDEHGPFLKRSKISSSLNQQWNMESTTSSQYNPLEEPSPLGLRLRKSPSLLELIQMRLSQGNTSLGGGGHSGSVDPGRRGDKESTASATTDKLKASNFPASLLKIGTWEYVSKYEGDLVAKCYFAKHKLVWEVLEGGLKSKIEIQWSDITALKANFADDKPATLDIELSRKPLFFREINPQPRKHTLWQGTSDFTCGQASIHRRHFLQCPQGLLSKHFEKLIQCDPRLNLLSQQPGMISDSLFSEHKGSVFDEPAESKSDGFDQLNRDYATPVYGFRDAPSPSASLSSSSKSEMRDLSGDRAVETSSWENPSPSSDSQAIEVNSGTGCGKLKGLNHWDQFKVPGFHPSMSMTDLFNHLGNCISEQMTSDNPHVVGEGLQNKDMLDEISQHLLGDSHFTSASDEKALMSRVNSLCCLLQKDSASIPNFHIANDELDGDREDEIISFPETKVIGYSRDHESESRNKQAPTMSRKDSLGDLLLHLPRVASLPQFLSIAEDGDNQAR